MALTTQQIQKAYVAFFNRPADVSGLNNWLAYKGNDADLLNTFAQSTEYTDLFAGKTSKQIVETVYHNLFARTPDAGGLQNWVNNLDAGKITIGNIAYTMLNSAGSGDIDTIAAKLAAAESFTSYLSAHKSSSDGYENGGASAGTIVKGWFAQIGESGSGKQGALNTIAEAGSKLVGLGGNGNHAQPGSEGVITGTEGDDDLHAGGNYTLNGLGGDDELWDGGYNVVLNGGTGDDTYNLSFTGDVIVYDAGGIQDDIFFGGGTYPVRLEELSCKHSGKNLVLTATGHTGTITIVDFYQKGHAIEEMHGFYFPGGAWEYVDLVGVANSLADGASTNDLSDYFGFWW